MNVLVWTISVTIILSPFLSLSLCVCVFVCCEFLLAAKEDRDDLEGAAERERAQSDAFPRGIGQGIHVMRYL